MKRLAPSLIAVAILAGFVVFTARAPRHAAAQQAASAFVTEIAGGWGFGHFRDGKPSSDQALMGSCFPCHQQVKARDLVFTRYAL
jgi:hypothetical protein